MSTVTEHSGGSDRPVDGRATRWDGHRKARRDHLLTKAIEVIDRDGGEVGVADIAEAAGFPRSVVYRLFKDRADLDEQIRRRIIDDVMTDLAPALAVQGTIRESVRTAIDVYVAWVSEHPQQHRFLGTGSAANPVVGARSVMGAKTAIAVSLTEVVKTTRPDADYPTGSAENVAFGLVGLVDGVVNRWVSHPENRTSKEKLSEFLTEAACSLIQTGAKLTGVDLDVDQPVR